ncbi:hypothetical protein O6H91_03G068000 [Diphasiastrum complanatum]|uniref:Uncharacterized protein n=1 Tax=Diphasiastrum complanatum TaxID=34168 RepID=A0ACC2E7D1_DIPCM|nr:hypothetical protein O6H91_03G068000 [Diphasiastrum complanatum]
MRKMMVELSETTGFLPQLRGSHGGMEVRSQAQVLAQAQLDNKDGIKPVLSNVQQLSTESGYDESGESGQQIKQGAPSSIAPPPPPGEYILPHVQLELGQSLTAYPYADPYFGGIVADYRSRVMFHPHILGIQQARMPLPSEMVEEEPVYVNAKQYHGILRRRQIRAKAESENKLVKSRKPYLHESRHQHALKRARGCGGRFLNKKSTQDSARGSSNSFPSLDMSSLQTCASTETKLSPPGHEILASGVGEQESGRLPEAVGSITQSPNVRSDTNLSSQLLNSSTGVIGSTLNHHQNQSFHLSVFHSSPEGFDADQTAQKSNIVAAGAQQKAVATQ